MRSAPPFPVLCDAEFPAVELCNGDGRGGIILVCEHASNTIPTALDGLGLNDTARASHAAWDIGARDVALAMSAALDAPLVAARVSRLVYDCNRPPESPGAMPDKSEVFEVPGNRNLSATARAARVAGVYLPFQSLLRAAIDAAPHPPVLITIHSFTPVYFGKPRSTQLGFLHDSDSRYADAMLRAALDLGVHAEMNAPYAAADGVTHTLREHAVSRGLLNVMIEIRNDLIDTPQAAARMAAVLCTIIPDALKICAARRE